MIDGPLGVRLVSALGRLLPLQMGFSLADLVARRIASARSSPLVRAVSANQWVVSGESLDKSALDQAVLETFRHSARCLYTFHHYRHDPTAASRLVIPDENIQQLLQRPEFDQRGLMVLGLHLSNFDLVLHSLCQAGLKALILTLPDPQGGRRLEMEMRQRQRINLVPASVETFLRAIRVMQQGGLVLTGIDRPVPETKLRPRFFGRPAQLSTHPYALAARAHVPVMLLVVHQQPDGKYQLRTSPLIEMEQHPDREKETILNAEKVLNITEGFIRQFPRQWAISLPVWPEVLDLVPQ